MFRLVFALLAFFGATGALAQGSYTIQPGDSLRVEVIEDASLNRDVLVTPDGRISFPFAGSVSAAGRTTEQLGRAIASQLEPNFANPPTVFVAVQGLARADEILDDGDLVTVFILGEVNSPGPREVERGTSILQLLSTAGGFTNFAATKRIQLRRQSTAGERVVILNYHAVSRGAAMRNNVVLHEGDVILVPERRLFE